jgi:hypothetical protein
VLHEAKERYPQQTWVTVNDLFYRLIYDADDIDSDDAVADDVDSQTSRILAEYVMQM